jgi:hypothetical protein
MRVYFRRWMGVDVNVLQVSDGDFSVDAGGAAPGVF